MKEKFQIIIGSPTNYEHLVAYVWVNGEEVALVHKEDGPAKMKIEFFDDMIETEIDLDVFIMALQEAKSQLLK